MGNREKDDPADFYERVAGVIEEARKFVGRTADITMSVTYFSIGHMIVEREQGGKARADYGQDLLKNLSRFLTERFKRGFSVTTLKNARIFYKTYSPYLQKELKWDDPEKGQALLDQFTAIQNGPTGRDFSALSEEKQEDLTQQTMSAEMHKLDGSQIGQSLLAQFDDHEIMRFAARCFRLGWTHYMILMRIENEDERRFYEIEAEREGWSYRFLKRQYHSSLYERLALSKNKDEVMRLAREGQTVEKPEDILKSPLVLEFLGMAEDSAYSETELEAALISKLQYFLLELGKGYLFEARQKRFTFDGQSFFVDLVLYNRLLRCFVLIDLKTEELKHQDLGQMQMYVNYYDRFVKKDFERPSVGFLLCKKTNDSIVELTLPQDAQIYASEYSLYLPDKEMLRRKLAEWEREFEEEHGTGRRSPKV